MHPYCCLHSIRRNLCKIVLAFCLAGDFCHETDNIKVSDLMGVSKGLWRASIGRFHASFKSYYESKRKPGTLNQAK